MHRPAEPRSIVRSILVVVLILATVAFAVHALALLYDGRYSVTRQDYWRIYALDFKFPFPLNALYRHNDHPTFFPSLIWLPILFFFQNNQTLLFWIGQAVTLTTVALLLVSLWRSPSLGLLPRLALGLLYTLASLWLGKINVTASGGFSCMTSLLLSAVVLGFLALGRMRTTESARIRRWLFAGVLAAGVVATFSFGTGMAAWPTFVLLALFYRLGWKIAAALGVAGVVNFIIFLLLPNNGESAVGDGLSHLLPDLPHRSSVAISRFWARPGLITAPAGSSRPTSTFSWRRESLAPPAWPWRFIA